MCTGALLSGGVCINYYEKDAQGYVWKGSSYTKVSYSPCSLPIIDSKPHTEGIGAGNTPHNALYLVQIANISKIQFSSAVLVAGGPGRFTMTRADL